MRRSRSWRRFGRRAAASSPTTSSSPPTCPAAARPRPSQRATSSSRANQRCSRAPARWSGKTRASRRTRRSPRREPSSSRSAEPRRRWARRRERRRPSSGWGTATRTTNSRKAARGRSGTTRRGATGTCFYFLFIVCLFLRSPIFAYCQRKARRACLGFVSRGRKRKAEGEEGRGKGGRD